MTITPDDDEDEAASWFRPVWEIGDEDTPPGQAPVKRAGPGTKPMGFSHPLLTPLAQAQDAVARLEGRLQGATATVAQGLRARLAWREAAGWLAYSHVWIHPWDLALRDAGSTGSFFPAMFTGQLATTMPSTAAQGAEFEIAPSDITVNRALRFARYWRRLVEMDTWRPYRTAADLHEALQELSDNLLAAGDVDEWLSTVAVHGHGPALLRVARGAREWMNRPQVKQPLSLDGIFLAACLWRENGFGRPISLPFWLAPELQLNRLGTQFGVEWAAGFLGCVAAAGRTALAELNRLQDTAAKGKDLSATARSHLPAAFDYALRVPVVTGRSLAQELRISAPAALTLIRQLVKEGLMREATGRASFRVFMLA